MASKLIDWLPVLSAVKVPTALTVVLPIVNDGGLSGVVPKVAKVTPFTVAGPNGPVLVSGLTKLNALSNVPRVLTSETPEIVVAGPQVMVAASACSATRVKAQMQHAQRRFSNSGVVFRIGRNHSSRQQNM